MAKIIQLSLFPQKKAPKQNVASATIEENGGLTGDFHMNDGARAISLMGIETIQKVQQKEIEGLCSTKFQANLITKDLHYKNLQPGNKLNINGLPFLVESVGKDCFIECTMRNRSACPLRDGCAFGRFEVSGTISLGDEIVIKV